MQPHVFCIAHLADLKRWIGELQASESLVTSDVGHDSLSRLLKQVFQKTVKK